MEEPGPLSEVAEELAEKKTEDNGRCAAYDKDGRRVPEELFLPASASIMAP